MQAATVKLTGSTTVLPAHGLNEEQLANIQDVVQDLETHLLYCVDDNREGRWLERSRFKTKADLRLRDLLVCPQISHFQDRFIEQKLFF